jgi:hypothetical protein
MQYERDQTERNASDAATVSSVLAGAVHAGREPRGTSQIARKNDEGEHSCGLVRA